VLRARQGWRGDRLHGECVGGGEGRRGGDVDGLDVCEGVQREDWGRVRRAGIWAALLELVRRWCWHWRPERRASSAASATLGLGLDAV
jgi:hypothetical protein